MNRKARERGDQDLAADALLTLVRRQQATPAERRVVRGLARTPVTGVVAWRRGASAAHLHDDALAALAAADPSGPRPPVLWLHWPVDANNPYQQLLYSRFAGQNLIPTRLHHLADALPLAGARPAGTGCVLHVHWLYLVTEGAVSRERADRRVTDFTEQIGALRAAGVRLVWTVHNLLPHETEFPDVETRLRRFMLRTADVVHVMDDAHPALLRESFGLDAARWVTAPHPSFAGAYPDWVDRAAARAQLGIPADARVLTTFGQIRPYKGHADFLDIMAAAAERAPELLWLVAGKVRDEPGGTEFLRRAARSGAVLLHPAFIPDQDVQYYLRAADAAVFPYRRSLNSGAVALTAAYDLPAYASVETGLGGLLPEAATTLFDLADPESVVKTIVTDRRLGDEATRRAVREHIAGFRPAAVSDRFARAMRAWFDDC